MKEQWNWLKLCFQLTLADITDSMPEVRWEFKRPFVRGKKNFKRAFGELFDDVGSAVYELFIQIPKDIKTFILTLWAYKGLLWNDRNWDHAFILRLLQLKIRRTKEYIGKHQRHTRWKLDVKNMQKAEDLIESILEDNAGEYLREAHDKKWGKAHTRFVECEDGRGSLMRTLRERAYTPDEQKQERNEYGRMLKKIIRLEQKQWSALWKHLDKHMRSWWD